MNRVVRGSDGRLWNVRSSLEWSNPIAGDDFEHDVNGGRGPGIMMFGILILLALLFVLWTPEGVHVPIWLVLALIVAAMFFPVRWLLHRPWTIIAETPGDEEEHQPERPGAVDRVQHATVLAFPSLCLSSNSVSFL